MRIVLFSSDLTAEERSQLFSQLTKFNHILEDEVETIKNQNLRIQREGFKVSSTSLPSDLQQSLTLNPPLGRRDDDLALSRSTVSSDATDDVGCPLSRNSSVSEGDGGIVMIYGYELFLGTLPDYNCKFSHHFVISRSLFFEKKNQNSLL